MSQWLTRSSGRGRSSESLYLRDWLNRFNILLANFQLYRNVYAALQFLFVLSWQSAFTICQGELSVHFPKPWCLHKVDLNVYVLMCVHSCVHSCMRACAMLNWWCEALSDLFLYRTMWVWAAQDIWYHNPLAQLLRITYMYDKEILAHLISKIVKMIKAYSNMTTWMQTTSHLF